MDEGAEDATWWFHCSACGKCCNSAPEMSVPELLYHQHRFVGSLAIRRIPRLQPGDRLGPRGVLAGEADCCAHAELADAILHPLPDGGHVLLATHAYGADAACPALGRDMRCTIHDDHKPAACAVVPLDALVPDRLQHAVLAERSVEAAYLGADCLAPSPRATSLPGPGEPRAHSLPGPGEPRAHSLPGPGEPRAHSLPGPGEPRAHSLPLLRAGAVVETTAREALARRRGDLADEKTRWGRAVFAMLRAELFASPAGLARLPAHGFIVMAIAPVLMALAAASPSDRRRCIEYVDAQIVLIDRRLRAAPSSPGPRHGQGMAQLQAFARTHRALRTSLAGATA